MNYVIIGAGGTGGILGAALYRAGYQVSLIARGAHLRQIRENGLVIKNQFSGTKETLPIPAYMSEEFEGNPDVVFVCVKGYSVSDIVPFIDRISTADTIIIPLLNIFTTGESLRERLPGKYVLDGCIYVSANIEKPGVLLQHSRILKVVFGAVRVQEEKEELNKIRQEMDDAGITAVLSENIRRDALKKFCYVSPIGAAGLFYNVTAGSFQADGAARDLFIGMMKEVEALAEGMGCPFDEDVIGINLKILSHQPPDADTSLQRDVLAGRQSEIEGLIYIVPVLGKKYGVETPLYSMVTEKLKKVLKRETE